MRILFAMTLIASIVGANVAHADDDVTIDATEGSAVTPGSAGAGTSAAGTDTFTLPKSKVVIDAFLEVNLSSGDVGKPISVTPDIWYGATDDLTVGLVHSSLGATGFLGVPGDSLCLSGSGGGCASIYNDVGADVRYRLKAPLTFDGGLYIVQTSPDVDFAVKLGIDGRWRFGKIAVEAEPNLFIELTNRGGSGGQSETLDVPVTGSYAYTKVISFAAQTGVALPFSNTGSTYRIPLSLAARYAVTPKLDVGLVFTLLDLVGGGKDTGFDARTVVIGGSYAL